MSRSVLCMAVLSSFILAGCGKKALKDKVVGKWNSSIELDDAKMDESLKDVPEAAREKAKEQMREGMAGVSVEYDIKADGTYSVTMTGMGSKEDKTKGKWEVESAEGDVLKLKMSEEGKSKADVITLTFKGDDEFGFSTDAEGFKEAPFKTPIKFTRAK